MLNHVESVTTLCAYDGGGDTVAVRHIPGKLPHDELEALLREFVVELTASDKWGGDVTATAQSIGGNPSANGFIVEVTYGADTENNYMRSASEVSMEPLLKGVDY